MEFEKTRRPLKAWPSCSPSRHLLHIAIECEQGQKLYLPHNGPAPQPSQAAPRERRDFRGTVVPCNPPSVSPNRRCSIEVPREENLRTVG